MLEGFWDHLEVKNRLGGSMEALFLSELDFPGSTPPILELFGELLERVLMIFCYLLLIQTSQ